MLTLTVTGLPQNLHSGCWESESQLLPHGSKTETKGLQHFWRGADLLPRCATTIGQVMSALAGLPWGVSRDRAWASPPHSLCSSPCKVVAPELHVDKWALPPPHIRVLCSDRKTRHHTYGEAFKKSSTSLRWGWGNSNPAAAKLWI